MLFATFSNELEGLTGEFILVLDDYHTIRGTEVHNLLGELARHWPRPLHLVLISRINPPIPLSSLRAKGMISEIRTRDLRFTPEETAVYLSQSQTDPGKSEHPVVSCYSLANGETRILHTTQIMDENFTGRKLFTVSEISVYHLVNALSDAAFICDRTGCILACSDEVLPFFGITDKARIIGSNFQSFIAYEFIDEAYFILLNVVNEATSRKSGNFPVRKGLSETFIFYNYIFSYNWR